ncbi:DDE-type integrase/transposase/recombinase [Deinococcus planocerae]|uniref:DDE-type integrase/transposase/recombinase n=1 Tax=Deinococcus planocerae TaxID=1737569 RepID=UPI000C7F1D0B|nr:DDE-type integrase/transposase/recombinase [Deinococcus planocerae]
MTLTARLTTGMRLLLEDREWRVELGPDIRDGQVILHAPGEPPRVIALTTLIAAPTFRMLTDAAPLSPYAAHFERLPHQVKAAALEREEHVLEVLTGFRSGRRHPGRPEEPLPAFDPASTPLLKDRIDAKAAVLGVNRRQVERWLQQYRDSGHHPFGLIDRRSVRLSNRLGAQAPALADALLRVAKDLEDASDVTFIRIRELVEDRLEHLASKGLIEPVKLPHQTTFIRLVDEFAPQLSRHAKRRRSEASRGQKRPFGKVVATRPGQLVVIDISPFDILVLSEVDGQPIRLRLVLAIDLYTRAIVAADLLETELKGVDVSSLLLDIVFPTLWHPSWPVLPEEARLPYVGIPEAILLQAHGLPDESVLANVPPMLPDAVVVDNGKVFLSSQFRELCRRLGCDIILARPLKGSDKAHIERLFLHVRTSLAERLKGYVGPHVLARGSRVAAFHFRFEVKYEVLRWITEYYNRRSHEGLAHPRLPKAKLSPVEMYDLGLAHAGYLTIPLGRDAYYLALRSVTRIIGDEGIRVDGRYHDSDVLNPYRHSTSPFVEFGGLWPVLVDDRDPTYVFFQEPETGTWHALPDRDADWAARPFEGELLEQVKYTLAVRGFAPDNHADVAAARRARQREYDARVKAAPPPEPPDRPLPRAVRNDLARLDAAARDREARLSPSPIPPAQPGISASSEPPDDSLYASLDDLDELQDGLL